MKAPTWKDPLHRERFLTLLTQARFLSAPQATDETLAAIMLDHGRRSLATALYVLAVVEHDFTPYFDNEAEDMMIFGHCTPNFWDVLEYQGDGLDDAKLIRLAASLYADTEYQSATGTFHGMLAHLGQTNFLIAVEALCWRFGTQAPSEWTRLFL